MFHTVYNSYETKPSGRDYIGKHSTDDLDDSYLGSYKDKTFNPDSKIVFAYAKTAEGAIWLEMQFQKVFKVVEDPQFANKAYQTATKFDTTGTVTSDETKRKLREAMIGRVLTEETKNKMSKAQTGKVRTKETIQRMRESQIGKTQTEESKRKKSEALIGRKCPGHSEKMAGEGNPMYGKTGDKCPVFGIPWWVNSIGETCRSQEYPGLGWQRGRKWKFDV